MEATEKVFDPALKVVDANLSTGSALSRFGCMGGVGIVIGFLLYSGIMWMTGMLNDKFAWLSTVASVVAVLLCCSFGVLCLCCTIVSSKFVFLECCAQRAFRQ